MIIGYNSWMNIYVSLLVLQTGFHFQYIYICYRNVYTDSVQKLFGLKCALTS